MNGLNPLVRMGNMQVPDVKTSIRRDLAQSLEQTLKGLVGRPGTDQHARMTEALKEITNPETGQLDLDKLPDKARKDLLKLQSAAEGFESIFVKGLLSQMRKTSFSEKPGPYAEMAKDMLDQALADQTSQSSAGVGIAATVFTATAPRLVRETAAYLLAQAADRKPDTETPSK
jgi:hypothetical protein